MVYLDYVQKHGKIISGSEVVEENISRKKAKMVIIAEDASEKTKQKFTNLCTVNNVPYFILGDIETNSKFIGKTNRAIIGITDDKFYIAIRKIIYGGDTNGEN